MARATLTSPPVPHLGSIVYLELSGQEAEFLRGFVGSTTPSERRTIIRAEYSLARDANDAGAGEAVYEALDAVLGEPRRPFSSPRRKTV